MVGAAILLIVSIWWIRWLQRPADAPRTLRKEDDKDRADSEINLAVRKKRAVLEAELAFFTAHPEMARRRPSRSEPRPETPVQTVAEGEGEGWTETL